MQLEWVSRIKLEKGIRPALISPHTYTTEIENEMKKFDYETQTENNDEDDETQRFLEQIIAENSGEKDDSY